MKKKEKKVEQPSTGSTGSQNDDKPKRSDLKLKIRTRIKAGLADFCW